MKGESLLKSFLNAIKGLGVAFRSERNFRIHSLAAIMVIFVAFALPFEVWQRSVLLLVTLIVLVLELANSSLERLVDLAKPRVHEYAAEAKDLMAGAVFLAAVFAVIIAFMILLPRLIETVNL